MARIAVAGPSRTMAGEAMRQLKLSSGVLFSLTDAVPDPAAWEYSFPETCPDDHPQVADTWLPDRKFRTRFTVVAFERHGRVILVDAGLGAGPSPYFNGLSGQLPDELRAAGLVPAAVDHVFFTHFHLDHLGWSTDRNGKAFFPNARYHAPEAEIAHWRKFGDKAALSHHVQAFKRHLAPLFDSNRLEAAKAGALIASVGGMEVSYRAVPGHTAGHCAVVIAGGAETLLIAGDTWHSPAQIAVPEWCHRADRNAVQARQSRNALANWAYDRQAIVAAGHFPEGFSFGRIQSGRSGQFTFAPIAPLGD